MAVDRGELRYKIAIEDQFTKPIQTFRAELLKAKNTLEFVQQSTTGFKGIQRDLAAATVEMRRFGQASAQAARATTQATGQTARAAQQANASAAQAAQQAQASARAAQQAARASQQAQAGAARAAQQNAQAQSSAAGATRRHAAEARALNKELFGTEKGVNRVAFTFRRLFGILAAFTIAREVVQGFAGLVVGSVEFNRTIEESRIGLAGLFTALAKVRDASGQLQVGPDAFNTALGIADEQIQKLQADALKTTATFQQLVETFQVAVGPGLAAGLNVDEVRQVAVLVSQAASALRISQDQLSEEIRALLTGAGTQRTSRIFTALGFSGPEINAAKDAGVLFELLERRLRAFGKAAEAAQFTFTGLTQRLSEAISLVSGRAGLNFFDDLKNLLSELGDIFVVVERNAEGVIDKITPRPETLATLAILFEGLERAVNIIRAGFQSFSLREVQNAVAFVSDAFAGIAQLVVGFVRGLTSGLSDVAVIAKNFFNSFDNPLIQETVALVTRLGTILAAASLSISALAFGFKILVSPITIVVSLLDKMLAVTGTIFKVIGKVPGTLFTWVGIIAAIFLGFGKIFEQILGFPLSFKDIAKIFGLTFQEAFVTIVTQGEIAFKQFANVIVGIFTAPVQTIANLFLDLFQGILGVASGLASVLGLSEDFVTTLENGVQKLNEMGRAKTPKLFDEKEIALQKQSLQQFLDDSKKAFAELSADIATRTTNKEFDLKPKLQDTDLTADLLNFIRKINEELSGLIGADIIDEDAIVEKLNRVKDKTKTGALEASATIDEQVLTSFDKLINKMRDSTAASLNILTAAVNGFSSFAADAIVSAFDPNNDKTIKERFAEFLQSLARQIIQTIITLLIATAIAKAFGVPLPSDPTPPPGLAEGGEVPGGNYQIPRPSYIPKSDTTPAWLTPGEIVQSLGSVRKYGADVLLAINDGLIDPLALRSLAGLESRKNVRTALARSGALSFADGGLVPAASFQAAQDTVSANTQNTSASPPIAVVVGNDQTVERLLSGGKRAFLDHIRGNAGAINGILSQNRTN